VTTSRLDSILSSSDLFDFVNLDIQDADSQAIEDLGNRIKSVNWVFIQVSKRRIYAGSTPDKNLDSQSSELGFKRFFTVWERRADWRDLLFAKPSTYTFSKRQLLCIQPSRLLRFGRGYISNWAFPTLLKSEPLVRSFL